MTKNIMLFPTFGVRVENVKSESVPEMIDEALETLDFKHAADILDHHVLGSWYEIDEIVYALVDTIDENGDLVDDGAWFDGTGKPVLFTGDATAAIQAAMIAIMQAKKELLMKNHKLAYDILEAFLIKFEAKHEED